VISNFDEEISIMLSFSVFEFTVTLLGKDIVGIIRFGSRKSTKTFLLIVFIAGSIVKKTISHKN